MANCGLEIDTCLTLPDVSRVYLTEGSEGFEHNKTVETLFQIGPVSIPVRKRDRTFNLSISGRLEKGEYSVVRSTVDYDYECYKVLKSRTMSVSENATYTDASFYIVDTENSNCFWKETTYTCDFSGTSSSMAGFHPTGDYHKIRFDDVHIDVEEVWKLMLNGVVDTLHTGTRIIHVYTSDAPLIIIWPLPPSMSQPTDADVLQYGFYDYFGGNDNGESLHILDGGADFYNPSWLRMMGTWHTEDLADAAARYEDTYGAVGILTQTTTREISKPVLRGFEPRGSIVKDAAGNVFASVMVDDTTGGKLYFNRLRNKNSVDVAFPAMPDFEGHQHMRYFPVGLI